MSDGLAWPSVGRKAAPTTSLMSIIGHSSWASFADNKILIYREEEHSKLLIHELIHLFRIDLSVVNIENISKLVDINSSIQTIPNESITEILAVIINCIISSIEVTNKNDISLAVNLLILEIGFNLFQCAKILNHFGYTNSNEFFRANDGNKRFNQTTSVISYFFIKTACLFNSKELFEFLKSNFKNLNYTDIEEVKTNYKSLIVNSLNNTILHSVINNILLILRNSKKSKSTFFNTLRMTCVEVD